MSQWITKIMVALVVAGCFAVAPPAEAGKVVSFNGSFAPGTIVIRTGKRKLYLVMGGGKAIRYPVAVGRPGRVWRGATRIIRKAVNPTWGVPAEIRRLNPRMPLTVPPGPRNPLGPRALLLGNGEYAIHGTNNPRSIGRRASFGCIRMHNHHIKDLYKRVRVGTPVIAIP